MTKLIVKLPLQVATTTTEFAYALSTDGATIDRHAKSTANLLPHVNGTGDEIVALVPARAMSWHQVELPQGVNSSSPRLRAVLEGLLEERLLDEVANLHFALEPDADPGLPFWVAVCDKAWLRASLSTLDEAQCPVSRIVPEFVPGDALTPPSVIYLIGEPEQADLVIPEESGVTLLPVTHGALSLARSLGNLPTEAQILADPAVLDLAEKHLQRRAVLQTWADRALSALSSSWDIAQFDLANSGSKRALKRLSSGWADFLQSPRWRAARWGLLLLVVTNLIGLNALAWRETALLNAKREAIRSTLTQTFPSVQVIVDAPVQMEREMSLLRQAGGELSKRDIEIMLATIGPLTPPNRTLTNIEFANGEARIKGLGLTTEESSTLTAQLVSRGYSARVEGEALVVKTSNPQ